MEKAHRETTPDSTASGSTSTSPSTAATGTQVRTNLATLSSKVAGPTVVVLPDGTSAPLSRCVLIERRVNRGMTLMDKIIRGCVQGGGLREDAALYLSLLRWTTGGMQSHRGCHEVRVVRTAGHRSGHLLVLSAT